MSEYFEPMLCPVCEDFYFSNLQEGDVVDELYCYHCGWKYDLAQAKNHDLSNKKNEKSVKEYRKEYEKKIAENPNYDFSEENYVPAAHNCPVCDKYVFSDEGSFEICPFCGWQDDALMEDEPDEWAGNANDLCLTDYTARYKAYLSQKEDYKFSKDGYLDKV